MANRVINAISMILESRQNIHIQTQQALWFLALKEQHDIECAYYELIK